MVLEGLLQHPVHDLQVRRQRYAVRVPRHPAYGHALAAAPTPFPGVHRAAHVEPAAPAGVAGRLEPAALPVVLGERRRIHPGALQAAEVGDRAPLLVGPRVEARGDGVLLWHVGIEPECDDRPAGRTVLHRDPAAHPVVVAGHHQLASGPGRLAHHLRLDRGLVDRELAGPGGAVGDPERHQRRDVVLVGQAVAPAVGQRRAGRRAVRLCGHRDRWRARAKQKRP